MIQYCTVDKSFNNKVNVKIGFDGYLNFCQVVAVSEEEVVIGAMVTSIPKNVLPIAKVSNY